VQVLVFLSSKGKHRSDIGTCNSHASCHIENACLLAFVVSLRTSNAKTLQYVGFGCKPSSLREAARSVSADHITPP
jgi:hypothetical protein